MADYTRVASFRFRMLQTLAQNVPTAKVGARLKGGWLISPFLFPVVVGIDALDDWHYELVSNYSLQTISPERVNLYSRCISFEFTSRRDMRASLPI